MKDRKPALKETFDRIPALYDEMRPGYPAEFVAQIKGYADLKDAANILEIGPGTGQMTTHFTNQNFNILALELGKDMAAYLARKFAAYRNIEIKAELFENWRGKESDFDLFISAQAFHWIEPEFGINKAASLLRPGGTLALVWNLDISQHSEFYKSGDGLHRKYFPGDESNPNPPDLSEYFEVTVEQISKCPAFQQITTCELEWSKNYCSDDWIKLRNTMSPDLRLSDHRRQQFHTELKELIDDKFAGKVTRYYRAVCVMARKIN